MTTVYWSTIINICLALSGVSGHRIVDGTVAAPHSRPYMVFLMGRTANETFTCGGSLIRENVIMTAAHCNAKSITAYVGIHSVSKAERANLGIHVAEHFPHPDFNNKTLENDIMLLRGDSGGPLVCRIKKVNTAVGVVSWGSPNNCNYQMRLNIYTKVSAYYKWIIATLKIIPQ
ncbi:duodenase-1-like [Polypterus senegalus]|uniref:duodenase-1-like n=1 Tax=Polypterus senegalus TaxID=55291 RepID=UPI00196481CC|nr:duodenase-1-like [Polypterus senegalus]